MLVISEHNIVAGLDWSSYGSKKLAMASVPKGKGVHYVTIQAGDEVVMAWTTLLPESKGAKAGAMILAKADVGNENILVFHKCSPDLVWVCAVMDGKPVEGCDKLLPPDEAFTQYQSLKYDMGSPVIYGDVPEARATLSSLLEVVDSKSLKSATLKQDSKAIIILGGGIALALLLSGAMAAFFYHQHQKAEEERIALEAQLAAAEQERAQREALAQFIQIKKAEFSDIPDARALLQQWIDAFEELPISVNGWAPEELLCNETSCKTKWKRLEGGSPAVIATLQRYGSMTKESNEVAFTSRELLSVERETAALPDSSIREFFESAALLWKEPATLAVVQPSEVFSGVPEGFPDISQQQAIGREGLFSITATSTYALRSRVSKTLLPGVFMKSMTVTQITPDRSTYLAKAEGGYRFVQ